MRKAAVVLTFILALAAASAAEPDQAAEHRAQPATTHAQPKPPALWDLTAYLRAFPQAAPASPGAPPTTTPAPTPPPAPVAASAAPGDAGSVATADWSCIRTAESGNRYNSLAAPAGAYGIEEAAWHEYGNGTWWPYMASPAAQDAAALRIFAANGDRFSGAWNNPCTRSGGGWLA